MNWDQLKKNLGYRVQLEPVAIRLDDIGRELPPRDDDWLIQEVTATGVRISNITTGHATTLGKDHVHHFTSNPDRSVDGGLQHGFLSLHVQIYLQGINLSVRPCSRPGERLPPAPVPIVDKWVDFKYPSDSGIQANLESLGYRVAWCFDSRLARKVELEGWEIVVEKDSRGMPTSFHLRDNPGNQVLIKTRLPDLDALAIRANVALRSQPGFLGCVVESISPPVLAFRFTTPVEAVRFQLNMSGGASPFRYSVASGRLDTILEHRA